MFALSVLLMMWPGSHFDEMILDQFAIEYNFKFDFLSVLNLGKPGSWIFKFIYLLQLFTAFFELGAKENCGSFIKECFCICITSHWEVIFL